MKALISLTLLVILSSQATAADLIKITPQQQKNLNIYTVEVQAATSTLENVLSCGNRSTCESN